MFLALPHLESCLPLGHCIWVIASTYSATFAANSWTESDSLPWITGDNSMPCGGTLCL